MSAKGYKNNYRRQTGLNRRHYSNLESFATKKKTYRSGRWTAQMEQRRYEAEETHVRRIATRAVVSQSFLATFIAFLNYRFSWSHVSDYKEKYKDVC